MRIVRKDMHPQGVIGGGSFSRIHCRCKHRANREDTQTTQQNTAHRKISPKSEFKT
jgi:hypothetical protein